MSKRYRPKGSRKALVIAALRGSPTTTTPAISKTTGLSPIDVHYVLSCLERRRIVEKVGAIRAPHGKARMFVWRLAKVRCA